MNKRPYSIIFKLVPWLTFLLLGSISIQSHAQEDAITATITTNIGTIEIDLFSKRTPKTVDNFVDYTNSGFYNDTVFHRVIPNFMIQGGGFDQNMIKKPTNSPIKNEANAFIPNLRGTIAMARTNDPHSATSQFFINVKDNTQLNKSVYSAGYAVFGKVTKGMDIADKISRVKTGTRGHYRDVPVSPVIIQSIKINQPE